MAYKRRMSRKRSKSSFRRGTRVQKKNTRRRIMRGGWRL